MGDSTRINRTLPSKDVADLLASFAPEVRNLAMPARTFVLEMIPTVTETVDAKAQVCMSMPTKAGVNLGIAYAMELPDPKKFLEGTGKLNRHVKLKSKSDLETAALRARLKAALARRCRLT